MAVSLLLGGGRRGVWGDGNQASTSQYGGNRRASLGKAGQGRALCHQVQAGQMYNRLRCPGWPCSTQVLDVKAKWPRRVVGREAAQGSGDSIFRHVKRSAAGRGWAAWSAGVLWHLQFQPKDCLA